ncbi:hypothetical protein OS493_017403 [Desmophyllum pertusum]|uniref:Uncharacterized protein n=1 Tax=Desmophyllum pertusum TaxID=174260 RepID=A0A9X0D9P9_9CNID|nr:hypothetical protein OS493_017403 [Desmophyllum pertusum]
MFYTKKQGEEYTKLNMMKPTTANGHVMVSKEGKFSLTRVIVGAFLAILFIFKDLAGVILFGIVRLLTESVRWLIKVIVRLAEEITVTSIRVVLRGVEEFLNVVIGIILQVVDNGSRVIIRRLRQIIGLLGYSVVVVVFAIAYFVHRIISLFFPER